MHIDMTRRSAYPVYIKEHGPRAQVARYKLRNFCVFETLNPLPYVLEVYYESVSLKKKTVSRSEAIYV
jgi:hypothetical protein